MKITREISSAIKFLRESDLMAKMIRARFEKKQKTYGKK